MYRKLRPLATEAYTVLEMRINKFLAQAGIASRRHADEMIKQGRVTRNGQKVTAVGELVDPTKDKLTVDGKAVEPPQAAVIYLLNKPKGVITTVTDPDKRSTVMDFVPKEPRVFPCGRLDEETMGLVLLTNDGTLCYQLTHPKFEHQKEYHVVGTSRNPDDSWKKLQNPPFLADGPIKIDNLVLNKIRDNKIDFTITIHDGRNRIVRRLCAKVGVEIAHLTRTRIGKYQLGDIAPGQYQTVTKIEAS